MIHHNCYKVHQKEFFRFKKNSILHMAMSCYFLLQSCSKNYNLASHSTYIVQVNFIHERRNLQFKVDSERQIFVKLFIAILFTLRVIARNLLRGSRRSNIFIFTIWYLTWSLNSSLMFKYHLDYGDFKSILPLTIKRVFVRLFIYLSAME